MSSLLRKCRMCIGTDAWIHIARKQRVTVGSECSLKKCVHFSVCVNFYLKKILGKNCFHILLFQVLEAGAHWGIGQAWLPPGLSIRLSALYGVVNEQKSKSEWTNISLHDRTNVLIVKVRGGMNQDVQRSEAYCYRRIFCLILFHFIFWTLAFCLFCLKEHALTLGL